MLASQAVLNRSFAAGNQTELGIRPKDPCCETVSGPQPSSPDQTLSKLASRARERESTGAGVFALSPKPRSTAASARCHSSHTPCLSIPGVTSIRREQQDSKEARK